MWNQTHKILGVLGGMGPLATQLFYKQIIERTEVACDQDHMDMIILSHASMPDRTAAILSGRTEDLYKALLEDAKRLENNGVTAIAIPCNTSHFFVDKLQKEISVPIIHMIRETVKTLIEGSKIIDCVGILATDGTLKSELYQKACVEIGIRPVVPTPESQKLVMKIIYDGIKGGGKIDFNDFLIIERELNEKGCKAAIMACTELSCFKELYHLSDYYIDAMEVLAIKSIEICGKKLKEKYK
ncbi:MAG: aspartate/glutamate racemase family protein [Anaerovoracaceae bacterium]|jgi:aspartate racemase